MKITVLADNRTIDDAFQTEHGLSIHAETGKNNIIMDTGSSDLFMQNASKLGIDLQNVDYVFISHGHFDHLGGLSYFLEKNDKAKVIMSSEIKNQVYYSKRKGPHSISVNFDFKKYQERIIFVDEQLGISDDIVIFKNKSFKYKLPKGNSTLFRKEPDGNIIPDDFNHELILTIGTDNLFVYTGCSHNGLLNILDTTVSKLSSPVSWAMGGFHLISKKDGFAYETDVELIELGNFLKTEYQETQFFTGHCTCDNAFNKMKTIMGNQLKQFYCGYILEI